MNFKSLLIPLTAVLALSACQMLTPPNKTSEDFPWQAQEKADAAQYNATQARAAADQAREAAQQNPASPAAQAQAAKAEAAAEAAQADAAKAQAKASATPEETMPLDPNSVPEGR